MSSNELVPSSGAQALQPTGGQARHDTRQFLTFRIGGEEYGIDILRVQEIRSYEPPTRVAHSPDFIKGVVNLRGVIVPIVDLRMRLGQSGEYNAFTVVIVLNVAQRIVGVVVDSVSDVLELSAEEIKPRPEVAAALDARFITGLGKIGERMLILLDIDTMVVSPDFGLLD
ncbi:chemotaxis protein CheW [Paucibacter aquatile]|jgi:purine-binding chemotaxis protein CheW|uniref:Chemotaxis protein CheW n=1 Tax=Kinneretia aquatilis TaxID=2070761 RepID=A0A2N8KWF8_9BURK|nr:chemotaxis protein CheW [Paucibacter aquatile]PND37799.1 chemotaxis protein CheW [Paucibacter aquatile]WIV96701.1 chemotaxis protein CheW [Paucibacter aquatile]